MALKGLRQIVTTDVTFFLNKAAEAGKLCVYKAPMTTGYASGVAIGDTGGECDVLAGSPPSGTKVLGILLHDFEDIDETVQHRNYQKVTQVPGERATILRNGWVVTDMISGSPTGGAPAYIGNDSKIAPTQTNSIAQCGEFMGVPDTAGFCKVYIKTA